MSEVKYLEMPMTGDESEDVYRQAINEQSRMLAVMGAQVEEMYAIFAQLKPMMNALPKMPAGMVPPVMPPMGILKRG